MKRLALVTGGTTRPGAGMRESGFGRVGKTHPAAATALLKTVFVQQTPDARARAMAHCL